MLYIMIVVWFWVTVCNLDVNEAKRDLSFAYISGIAIKNEKRRYITVMLHINLYAYLLKDRYVGKDISNLYQG